MTKIKDIETALLNMEEAANKHAEAIEQGDSKAANKNYAVMVKNITFLKNQNSIDKLSAFLNHGSTGVRLWASTYLLSVKEDEALKVLEHIASGTGILSFSAEMVVKEWKKGNLKL
jgi:hypothetical protein